MHAAFFLWQEAKCWAQCLAHGKGLVPVISWGFSGQDDQCACDILILCWHLLWERLPGLSFQRVTLFRLEAAFKVECNSLGWR